MLRPSNFLVIEHPVHGLIRVEILNVHDSGKLQVVTRGHDDDEPFDIDPNWIHMRFSQADLAKPWTLKMLLRAFWGHLVFGPVTRVICRAQDLNIWYTPLNPNQPRQYLGDNREVLKKFTRDEIHHQISFEYDFYFGFCGTLDKKEQASRQIPYVHSRVKDRIVEEDLEELCREDGPKMDSFHFSSSSNFHQPLLMTPEFAPTQPMEVLEKSTYSVSPPELGSLVCGVPVKSKRGISLAQWWMCPNAFYEFWKLLMADHPPAYSYETMQRLKWPGNVKLFQELALCAIFNKTPTHLSPLCQHFFQTLNHLVSL